MCQNLNSSNSQLDKVMTDEQFNQIVEAIISGKYSWACLLILRFAGYNPLHYIPYRTYNRLMKLNREQPKQSPQKMTTMAQSSSRSNSGHKSSAKLRDLCCLEDIERQSSEIKGGSRFSGLHSVSNLIFWREFSAH
ncbi:MAG: HetP family heterocyst commitment protein [Cyanobacteria bacterium J06621_8]